VDQIVLSLSARGLTTGEISAHFAKVYGASVSRETVSKITEIIHVFNRHAPAGDALGSGGFR
jgi:transposase-like protein